MIIQKEEIQDAGGSYCFTTHDYSQAHSTKTPNTTGRACLNLRGEKKKKSCML